MVLTKNELLRMVDHSLLKPHLSFEEIKSGCEFARNMNCISVCVNPGHVLLAKEILEGSNTAVGTVVGFPSGAHTTYTKAKEAEEAYRLGAVELDMVINISYLKSKKYDLVKRDIEEVVNASPGIVKVIFENHYLTKEEIVTACKLSLEAGAHFVKTSTGFAVTGATIEDIALMRKTVGDKAGVKAAGGINTLEQAIKLIEAGANRIGTSKTREIIEQF
jgi:deoxyribose-phosphate aldolase